jgi:polysaccharide export outer membrane protein
MIKLYITPIFRILPIFLILILAGCAEEQKFKETTSLKDFQDYYEKQQAASKSNVNIKPLVIENIEEESEYLLGAGDLLAIKVFESEKLNSEVRVSSRGIINVPLLGDVNVMNKTAAEVEQGIEDLYKKDYLHDPHVSVYIKEHISKQITLVGAVVHPGTYEYVAQRRLLDVLAIGQGLKEEAGSFAHITRHNSRTDERNSYIIDLDDLVHNGNMALNHVILGGDVIFIPESGQCFVDGAVRKPGTYALESNMTITEAIALAGGLAGYADDDSIKLIRFVGRGKERQVVSLSYNDLQGGLGDTLLLKDQDIIFAESSASGKMFSGAGFSIGFMGTGVTYKDPQK